MTNPRSAASNDETARPASRPPDLSDELIEHDLEHSDLTAVTFTLPLEIDAQFASVVGDFNEWDPDRGVMGRDEDGRFSCSIDLLPGRRYHYRFLLDGDRWINDWSAHAYAPNTFGGEDSVLDLTVVG